MQSPAEFTSFLISKDFDPGQVQDEGYVEC